MDRHIQISKNTQKQKNLSVSGYDPIIFSAIITLDCRRIFNNLYDCKAKFSVIKGRFDYILFILKASPILKPNQLPIIGIRLYMSNCPALIFIVTISTVIIMLKTLMVITSIIFLLFQRFLSQVIPIKSRNKFACFCANLFTCYEGIKTMHNYNP